MRRSPRPPPLLPPLLLLLLRRAALLPPPPAAVDAHGFLSSPRARNLVAYEDRVYHPVTPSSPLPEDCPNCLNRGGVAARCGVLNAGTPQERNYDFPQNALLFPMPSNVQGSYAKGGIVEVEVTLTAHHRGHFTFKGCPIGFTTESPTQECFDAHPLLFVSDEFYGANKDENFPERAYVAPENIPNKVYSDKGGFGNAMVFRYKLQLPEDLAGDLVLLQWYYVASNSGCVHEGYDAYDWPQHWIFSGNENEGGSEWEQKANVGAGLKPCDEVLPADGDGLPEQFWNCAEVAIAEAPPVQPQTAPRRPHSKTIIGYYASWQWYDRQKLAAPANMDFTKVTRVNFAFFQTDRRGNIWGTDTWADPNLLYGPFDWNPPPDAPEYCSWRTAYTRTCDAHRREEGLIHLAHAAGAEVYPSLGGWSLSDPFPAMAADEEARRNFVEKCAELIEDYGFDGLDIDWEYPGYEDHSGTPADTESYNLLLRDLRLKLDELGERTGKFYGLTAALPCGTSNIANIDIPTVAKYLTEFNLMTYDFFGSWSPTTGANAPLYDQTWGGDDVKDFSVDGCVRNWIEGGASPSAINIGLPFYGRSFLKAKGMNEKHEGNDRNTWFWDDGSPQYFNIVEKLADLVSVRDEWTKTQYAYKDSAMGGLVSYDDEQAICDKTEYCIDHNLNGFIIWELSGDLMPDLSTPLLDAVNSKLTDPDLDCRKFADNSSSMSVDQTTSGQLNFISNSIPSLAPITTAPLAPITTAPTTPLYCPDGATGPRQHNGCTGYYYCLYGIPKYPAIQCPVGTSFDENSSLCLHSESVTCVHTRTPTSMPTKRPSSLPTPNPTTTKTDAPVMKLFVMLGAKEQNAEPSTPTPSSAIPTAPSGSVGLTTTTQLLPVPGELVVSTAAAQGSNHDASCPAGYTGAVTVDDCRGYFFCIYAVPHLPVIHCESGELFDLSLNACMDASQVSCIKSIPTETPKPPKKTSSKPKPKSHSRPMGRPALQPSMPSLQPSPPSRLPTTLTQGPLNLDSKDNASALMQHTHANNLTSQQPDSELNPSLSVEAQNGSSNPGSSLSESSGEVHHKEDTFYSWSSSSTGHNNVPDTPLPDDFDLVRPFITIEILLGDSPGNVGWQLLSLDGSINIAKPPGAYGMMTAKSVVYEGISLQKYLTPTTGIPELSWTIFDVKGKGRDGGGWKLYSGPPGTPIAEVSEFQFMNTIKLAVTHDGLISLLKDDPSEQSAPFSGPTSLQNQGAYNFDPGGFRYIPSKGESKTSMLIPGLISSIVIALVVGLVVIVIAHKRKMADLYNARMMSERDDGSSFDEGSWNVEKGGPHAFCDHYNVLDQHTENGFYATDCASNIDPPDSNYGYIEKVHETNFTGSVDPPDSFDEHQAEPHATDFSTTPNSLFNCNGAKQIANSYSYNIDELSEEPRASEEPFESDIYSILDQLEEDIRKARV